MFCEELIVKNFYQASIREIRVRLVELQIENSQMQKIKVKKFGKN